MHFREAIVGGALILSGCAAEGPSGGVAGPVSTRLYETVMDRFKAYHSYPRSKAMAGCVQRPQGYENDFRILGAFSSGTSAISDTDVFIGRLMNAAKSACRSWRDKRGLDCDCVAIDSNGKNMLRLD